MTTRIYYPEIIHDENILLEGSGAHHLITVLRKKIGEEIILFDGDNAEYHTVINQIDKKRLWLTLKCKKNINRESPLSIHLIQAISKGDRMDWVVQKAVELGVARITPVITQHGAVKLDAERMAKKVEHWQNIAVSACEQCGRNYVPKIEAIVTFSDLFQEKMLESSEKWILHPEQGKIPLSPPLKKGGNAITLLIGPEGGFSSEEVQKACSAGYQAMSLGPRILRTETAAITAIAILQAYQGDM